MSKNSPKKPTAKSWRDVVRVHPAADLFPMMTDAELAALGENIKENGQISPVILWHPQPGSPSFLLDGRNRIEAMERAGLPVLQGDQLVSYGPVKLEVLSGSEIDPYEYVVSANIHRRHLTQEQRRDLIAKLLKAQPEKSNRQIASTAKVDHKTVGAVRSKLAAAGDIPQLDKTVGADGKARTTTPARKPVTPAKQDPAPDANAQHEARMDEVFGERDPKREKMPPTITRSARNLADTVAKVFSRERKLGEWLAAMVAERDHLDPHERIELAKVMRSAAERLTTSADKLQDLPTPEQRAKDVTPDAEQRSAGGVIAALSATLTTNVDLSAQRIWKALAKVADTSPKPGEGTQQILALAIGKTLFDIAMKKPPAVKPEEVPKGTLSTEEEIAQLQALNLRLREQVEYLSKEPKSLMREVNKLRKENTGLKERIGDLVGGDTTSFMSMFGLNSAMAARLAEGDTRIIPKPVFNHLMKAVHPDLHAGDDKRQRLDHEATTALNALRKRLVMPEPKPEAKTPGTPVKTPGTPETDEEREQREARREAMQREFTANFKRNQGKTP